MRWLILVALFALSGCWTGEALYAPTDSVPAIPPGMYRDDLSKGKTGRVSILPSGMTKLIADPEPQPSIYGFAPLDDKNTKFAIWTLGDRDGRPINDVGIYGLLQRNENGEFLFFMPDCSRTADIAVAAGARIETRMAQVCLFPDRASLETALRKWQPKPDEALARFVRIGD